MSIRLPKIFRYDYAFLIKDFLEVKGDLQRFVNRRFRDTDEEILLSTGVFETIGTKNTSFYFDRMARRIQDSYTDYSLWDLHPTDKVLDIGACVGGFSIRVHKEASCVYAVEPFMIEPLKKNIGLNNAKNITVLDCALGKGRQVIEWDGCKKEVDAKPLSEIIELCGGHIDFLKIDCEGGEQSIEPHELKGIRRIEAEVHNFNNYRLEDFEDMLNEAGYMTESRYKGKLGLVHAYYSQ